ncbi:MAG TPA: magnesium chelatase domain-containing protein, partial [Candidatus Gracilibacteria bacterium]|nr:magnesium chelatase domain-containing protein [Candidatus Gracilibacteria bacterium]
MLAKIHSLALLGMDCSPVEVEVDLARGISSFTIVGLGDTAVQEARERIRSAIKNTDCEFPRARVTINLAPANWRKNGVVYDLAMAVGIMLAKEFLVSPRDLQKTLFIGELSLDGKLRHVSGVLPMISYAKEHQWERIIVPAEDAAEASLIPGIEVIAPSSLGELVRYLSGENNLLPLKHQVVDLEHIEYPSELDFAHI